MLSDSSEAVKKALTDAVDFDVLEEEFGGGDTRPFDSRIYLNSPIHHEYTSILSTKLQEYEPKS